MDYAVSCPHHFMIVEPHQHYFVRQKAEKVHLYGATIAASGVIA